MQQVPLRAGGVLRSQGPLLEVECKANIHTNNILLQFSKKLIFDHFMSVLLFFPNVSNLSACTSITFSSEFVDQIAYLISFKVYKEKSNFKIFVTLKITSFGGIYPASYIYLYQRRFQEGGAAPFATPLRVSGGGNATP